MGCTIRTHRLNMELSSVVPPLVWLVTEYSASHRENGDWPPPGTVYDDSMMQFISSRTDGEDRIDTYDTLIDGRRIDFTLSSDGTIRASVRTEEREPPAAVDRRRPRVEWCGRLDARSRGRPATEPFTLGVMVDTSASMAGELAEWPSKNRMAAILRDAGLRVYVGRYSIRVKDCSHFVFREYGGDLGEPSIDADSDCADNMTREAKLVSDALIKAGIVHRFEIYDHRDDMVEYLHHGWPRADDA